jgi:CheY-like chemotaxis protein
MPDPGAPRLATRVVVADNDPDALDLVVEDLRHGGMDVVGRAADGDGAMALCEQERPDVLVVDYRMPPGPNGLEVARAVRRSLGTAAPRMILYTNYRSPDIAGEAKRLGVTVLPKGNIRALRRSVAGVAEPGLSH